MISIVKPLQNWQHAIATGPLTEKEMGNRWKGTKKEKGEGKREVEEEWAIRGEGKERGGKERERSEGKVRPQRKGKEVKMEGDEEDSGEYTV